MFTWKSCLLVMLTILLDAGLTLAQAKPLSIEAISLTVSNMERSVAFYENGLGFKKVSERILDGDKETQFASNLGARIKTVQLQLGGEMITLEQYLDKPGRVIPTNSRANDLWFQHFAIVVSDMDKAYQHLQQVPYQAISTAPQTIPASNVAAAGIKAYKFKDPDGHPLELIYFPRGKGRAIWHQQQQAIFLGIDHTAISIANTEKSLAFYRDILGLQVTGEGVNHGVTQQNLDHVPEPLVRITGLRPELDQGPGLEFLQYVSPDNGLPSPVDSQGSDLWHVHVVVLVDNLEQLTALLSQRDALAVSRKFSALDNASALMIKDPDGHVLLLVQKQGNLNARPN